MKNFCLITVLSLFAQVSFSQFNMNDVKKKAEEIKSRAEKTLKVEKPLSNDDIVKGLKEALTVGSNNSASIASKVNGYYKNPKLFIPFPPEAAKVESTLRSIGMGKKVDEFVQTLNRGAEDAAKQSAPIFTDAIKKMTITDGVKILKGNDNAATAYLQTNTSRQLTDKFKPVINSSLQKVSATKYWSDLINTYNKIPGVQKKNPDLAAYTTEKAINGLFYLVAQEELKIRKDPAARVTDLLKKVFSKQ